MASEAAQKKRGLGRGPNHVPKAPTNPDDRILIQIRPPPNSTYVPHISFIYKHLRFHLLYIGNVLIDIILVGVLGA